MNEKILFALGGALASLLALLAGGVQAASYSCRPLTDASQTAVESQTHVWALNNRVQVVGFALTPRVDGWRYGSAQWGPNRQAVLLNDDDGIHSDAFDINDAGQSVGQIYDKFMVPRAVTWTANQQTSLPPLSSGGKGGAVAINSRGKIVGSSEKTMASGDMVYRATLWFEGRVRDLGSLHKGGTSDAYSINDDGVVVGTSSNPAGDIVPVRWVGGKISALAYPVGSIATPNAVNKWGTIVGSAFYESDQLSHAFAWQDDTAVEMGSTSDYVNTFALAINAAGAVVGTGRAANGSTVPLLWSSIKDRPIDVNSLVGAGGCVDGFGQPRRLTGAMDINGSGVIVANAEAKVDGNPRSFSFILKPISP